jgi:hypothetical protein
MLVAYKEVAMVATASWHGYILLRSAVAGLWLVLALPAGIVCVLLVSRLSATALAIEDPVFFIPFLVPFVLAGALWARSLGRIAGYASWPLIVAGAVGVAVPTRLMFAVLTWVEANLARILSAGLPIHIVFTIAFATAALLLAGSGGLALGLSLRSARLAARLAFAGGGVGALTFLAVAIGFDLAGFRVGAPNAEQRATMLVVSIVGLWATALAGSAAIGRALTRAKAGS